MRPSTPISLRLKDVTLAQALTQLSRGLPNKENEPIHYYVMDGIVVITSAEAAARQLTTAFIDIRPIIVEMRKGFDAAYVNPWCFAGMTEDEIAKIPSGQKQQEAASRYTYPIVVEQIHRLITDVVDHDSWSETGIGYGSIGEEGGTLIVTTTARNIRRIRGVLDAFYKLAVSSNGQSTNALNVVPVGGGHITYADDLGIPEKTVTEYFNLRPLVDRLYTQAQSVEEDRFESTRGQILNRIDRLILDTVAPMSWRDDGGEIGSLRQLEWVMIVTHTPENIAKIRDILDCLNRATVANHFPSPAASAVAREPEVIRNDRLPDQTGEQVTAFINIHSLVKLWTDHLKNDNARGSVADLVSAITSSVAPPSWETQGARITQFGDLLVVTNTPKNVAAARKVLEDIYQAMSRGQFPSTSPSVFPDSQPSEQR